MRQLQIIKDCQWTVLHFWDCPNRSSNPSDSSHVCQGVSPSTPPHEKMWHWYRCRENALVTSWETSLDAQTQNIKQQPMEFLPFYYEGWSRFWIVSPEDPACPEKTEERHVNMKSFPTFEHIKHYQTHDISAWKKPSRLGSYWMFWCFKGNFETFTWWTYEVRSQHGPSKAQNLKSIGRGQGLHGDTRGVLAAIIHLSSYPIMNIHEHGVVVPYGTVKLKSMGW